jgi:hypothetical protein
MTNIPNAAVFEAVQNAPAAALTNITKTPPVSPNGANTAPNAAGGTVTPGAETAAAKGADHTTIPIMTNLGGSAPSGTPLQPVQGSQVSVGSMIEGRFAVEIIDAMLPAALVVVMYRFNVKLRKTELQLSEKEKSILAPLWQRCLDSILINFSNPWTALTVTSLMIYGSKAGEKFGIDYIDKMNEAKEKDALQAKADRNNPVQVDAVNKTDAEILKTANPAAPGPKLPPPFMEKEISDTMKRQKVKREVAIRRLQKKYNTQYNPDK